MTVVSLIVDGTLDLSTTAREVLGTDLPLIDDAVTIEHCMANRSGIGDYLDEDIQHDYDDYLMPMSVNRVGDDRAVPRGARWLPHEVSSGQEVLLLQRRFHGARPDRRTSQWRRVPRPRSAACLRARPAWPTRRFCGPTSSPADAAMGYLEVDGVWRSNVFHIPVRGNGDGGIYTTVADVRSLWLALFEGRIVPQEWVARW